MSNDKTTMKGMRANEMTPAFPTHPGDVLKDEIEYREFLSDSWLRKWALPILL